jgi:hypothetical protein
MSRENLHESWLAAFEARMKPVGGIPQVLQKLYGPGSAKEQVRKTFSPAQVACAALEYAADVGCVAPDHPIVVEFLAWNVEFCQLVLGNEEAWQSKYAMPNAQRSLVYGVLAFSKSILRNQELDETLLAASRQDAMVAFAEASGEHWEGISQSQYLFSIQFCLLEPDLREAMKMLNCGREFDWTIQWHGWLAKFIDSLSACGAPPLTDATAVGHFDQCFDKVRNPSFKRNEEMKISRALLSLQLAALRRKWIDGASLKGAWGDVLVSIANP